MTNFPNGLGYQSGVGNPQQFFPQPSGTVYQINSSLEVPGIPTGNGITVAICMPEKTLYIKTVQNNNPVLFSYRIAPFNETPTQQESQVPAQNMSDLNKIVEQLQIYGSRISQLEDSFIKLRDTVGINNPQQTQNQGTNTGEWNL